MKSRRARFLGILGLLLGGITLLVGLLYWRRRQPPARPTRPEARRLTFTAQGLSEKEARARYREGQSNAIHLRPEPNRREMIRRNTLSVFNIGLVAIIFVQLLLHKPLDALVSFGVLLFTVGVNVFQEQFALIRLRNIQEATQPKAIVLRDGQVRSIDPDEIVVGDVVEFGPGEQIMVDGRLLEGEDILMDETLVVGKNQKQRKQPGDEILAGSLCLSGRGIMETLRIDQDRVIARRLQELPPKAEALTPIERLINWVMSWLLAFVLAIAVLLMVRFYRISVPLTPKQIDTFIDAIGVVFSIAPAGLFFMIALTYAASTVDLSKLRVFVPRARAIETLAQLDMMILRREGFITTQWLEMTPLPGAEDQPTPSDLELRQMLGTFARSLGHQNQFTRIMQMTFEGLKLPPTEEMPFFAHYGWSGIRLEDEAMQGLFILGQPDILLPHQASPATSDQPETSSGPLGRVTGGLGRLFKRQKPATPPPSAPSKAAEQSPPPAEQPTGFFKRARKRLTTILPGKSAPSADQPSPSPPPEPQGPSLIFAWLPEPQPLFDASGTPHLPDGLIPLARLYFEERTNPEAVKALDAFRGNGVASKIFDEGSVEGIREALQQAGVDEELITVLRGISARELQALPPRDLAQAIERHHLIGDATPHLMTRAVQALREAGHLVGVVGSGAPELDAMMHADLSISVITGSSGALTIADIILLDTSPSVVTAMIDKGQRIVNGLLDVLKLYLTQAFYLLLLVLALLILLRSFPYRGAQGGLIAAFAISVPALALTLTAQPGRLRTQNLLANLLAFAGPASLTIAVTGYLVFAQFLRTYHDQAYAQIALVHALIAMGLLMTLHLRPIITFQRGRIVPIIRPNYLIPAAVALFSGLTFLLLTYIPLAQRFLYITPLRSITDYMLVGTASLTWAIVFGAYLLLVHLLHHSPQVPRPTHLDRHK